MVFLLFAMCIQYTVAQEVPLDLIDDMFEIVPFNQTIRNEEAGSHSFQLDSRIWWEGEQWTVC